jgi:methylthioribulose-1-phosphate dehydratase
MESMSFTLPHAIADILAVGRRLDARGLVNSQDLPALARAVEARLRPLRPPACAFLLSAHGIYTWGASMDEAERVFEALELLLTCELEALRIGRGG